MGEVLSIRANSSGSKLQLRKPASLSKQVRRIPTLPPGTDHRRSYTRAETR